MKKESSKKTEHKRKMIADIKTGETVNIRGFVENNRDKKSMQFIVLRDRSGKVQVTVIKDQMPAVAAALEGLGLESVISVTGKAVANPGVKLGGIEILPESAEVLSVALPSPINAESGPEFQMDYRWLDLRDTKKRTYFEIQTVALKAMRDYFVEKGFIEVFTPKLTDAGTEGGSEVFEVKYFQKKAYLTQSPQLYKQMAMAAGFEKYFEIGGNYRAEKSFTSRHATEFFALDVEVSYIDDHNDLMDLEEDMLKCVLSKVEAKCGKIMKEVLGQDFKAQTAAFPRITLYDAYSILKTEKNYDVTHAVKGDLDPDAERLLCEIAREKYNSDFIFITDFPASARAFYSKKHDGEKNTLTKSYDLLYKGVEITSGAQREHDPKKLIQNMRDKGINPDTMKSYIQFFEYGCPPHGGFALGLARFFARLFDVAQLREMTFLFRGPDRLAP